MDQPWIKNSNLKGSPSDRAQTSRTSGYRQQSGSSHSNSKGQVRLEGSKSQEIRSLELLYNAVRTSTGQDSDPKGGCFCQAREHALSSHTPICRSCGLILCTLNQPYYACPHCSSIVLTSIIRVSLEERCEKLISDTLAKEANEKQRAIDEAHRAAGAFPALPGNSTPPNNTCQTRSSNQTYKVMSLNSKTKKLTVSSYTPTSSTPSRSTTPQEVEQELRVLPPPVEVRHARTEPPPNRPWARLAGDNPCYVPVPRIDGAGGHSKSTSKAKRKHREKTRDDEETESNKVGERSEATEPST